ncbi:DUF429 domain-containing protein [Nitrospira sp. Kam-Ns4a]
MTWVAGVDGCRGGWIAVLVAAGARARPPEARLCQSFAEVLALTPAPAVIAVDIPIGLLDSGRPGGRPCDRAARRLLGRRASSVFSPPPRPVLAARRYDEVRRLGVSMQAFGLLPKIREVDRLMTPALQARIFEAHPELAFHILLNGPARHGKKTRTGRLERLRALARSQRPAFLRIGRLLDGWLRRFTRTDVAPDDFLDACALAVTALRILERTAAPVGNTVTRDARGLRMDIWA